MMKKITFTLILLCAAMAAFSFTACDSLIPNNSSKALSLCWQKGNIL